MSARSVHVGSSPTSLLLRSPRNWPLVISATAVCFLAIAVAAYHFERSPQVAGIAAGLGVFVAMVAIATLFRVCEIQFDVSRRCLRVRRGFGRVETVRYIPFTQVHAVRLTQSDQYGHHHSRIDVLFASETLRCPTTDAPRQQALIMAMAINARLIKIWQSTTPVAANERMQRLFGSESGRNME